MNAIITKILALSFAIAVGMAAVMTPASLIAQSSDGVLLDSIRRMRIKQQDEEHSVQARGFVNIQQQQQSVCTPVQQARQRIRDIEAKENNSTNQNVTINAGHEQLNITDNHGEINSNVDIQVINQGSENGGCL